MKNLLILTGILILAQFPAQAAHVNGGAGQGTITGVTAGTGITGGGTTGTVTVTVDATVVPKLGSVNTFSTFNTFTSSIAAKGTTSNDSAIAGYVGEYISSSSLTTAFPSTGVFGDLVSMTLTAGDWDVSLNMYPTRNGSTWTEIEAGISTTTGNSSTGLTVGDNAADIIPAATGNSYQITVPVYRMSLSGSTIIYAKYFASFSVATPNAVCRLSARRVR